MFQFVILYDWVVSPLIKNKIIYIIGWIFTFLLILTVGISRMYLGVHGWN